MKDLARVKGSRSPLLPTRAEALYIALAARKLHTSNREPKLKFVIRYCYREVCHFKNGTDIFWTWSAIWKKIKFTTTRKKNNLLGPLRAIRVAKNLLAYASSMRVLLSTGRSKWKRVAALFCTHHDTAPQFYFLVPFHMSTQTLKLRLVSFFARRPNWNGRNVSDLINGILHSYIALLAKNRWRIFC